MSKQILSLSVLAAVLLAVQPASATITVSLYGGMFADLNGVNVSTTSGTLFQLVALGSNGYFDEINVGDGSINGLDRWASGDDFVIGAAYVNDTEFATLAAFDLNPGTDAEAGIVNRTFQFDVPQGTKFGIRWFPGLQAAQFNSITLQTGQKFGQFTRQDDPLIAGPLYDGIRTPGTGLWVAPENGLPATTLDPLYTVSAGGPDDNSLGQATFTVVPEPAALALAIFGAIGVFGFRRRRS